MTKAAFSLRVFGAYLGVTGITLVAMPNLLLATFGEPPTTEVWIRVLGVVVILLAGYYWLAARHEATWLFEFSVYARAAAFVAFVVFVLTKLASPMLLVFGVVDLSAALWTFAALRADARA